MKGFTLVEILIVIAVMGILTGIGLTSFTFTIQKGRDAQRKSDLALISKAVVTWAGDFGGYPDDNGTGRMLACDPGNTFKTTGVFSACSWGGAFVAFTNDGVQTYLAKIPAEPQSSFNYYYKKSTNGFSLFSILENTSDPLYKADAGATDFGAGVIKCGTTQNCNYQVTEYGVK
ncbi:type II secretion system protein [Candidatus Collierbacteria bacterium]|nr:type II secretion system protein [Candidatus Collierbacteria bacterium]